jgi:NAD(P)-dependent dehydrogenase (short-subunit alcohol dehydrogenase family)
MFVTSNLMLTIFYEGIIMYFVITGTSRGIGLELTHHALVQGHHVLAIARKPHDSKELLDLKEMFKELEILAVDLLDQDAHKKIAQAVQSWPMVDVLINNAGIYTEDEKLEDFEQSFLTNSIKPLFITRALLPKLKLSKRAVSLQITSQMGSIADNSSGGSYSYRASKAALNMLFKSLSVDEKWLTCLQVHPGWVQTRMGGASAPTSPRESVLGIWKLITEASSEQSGSFLSYKGSELPW